jgi:factor associated with neutral sphingomyelinase activation
VFRRRHSLRETGLELQLQSGRTLFLSFSDVREREQFRSLVADHPIVCLALARDSVATMAAKWASGELSNFDYLMHVNSLADRTRNDLAQYPVFPWVLSDYSSPRLNLSDPAVYRDLSKPIGALNPQRLETFRARMREMPPGQQFLYGTHYSTPGYVLFYLVRKRPDLMLRLQNGKFDAPDRAFFSVAATWSSCLNSNTDVKYVLRSLVVLFFFLHFFLKGCGD